MDMEAGLEHLGRGTASMMDQFVVVIEPGARSVQTYARIISILKALVTVELQLPCDFFFSLCCFNRI